MHEIAWQIDICVRQKKVDHSSITTILEKLVILTSAFTRKEDFSHLGLMSPGDSKSGIAIKKGKTMSGSGDGKRIASSNGKDAQRNQTEVDNEPLTKRKREPKRRAEGITNSDNSGQSVQHISTEEGKMSLTEFLKFALKKLQAADSDGFFAEKVNIHTYSL